MADLELTAIIRQRPAPDARSHGGLPWTEVTATAATIEEAQADIRTRVPEDWQILSWRRTRG